MDHWTPSDLNISRLYRTLLSLLLLILMMLGMLPQSLAEQPAEELPEQETMAADSAAEPDDWETRLLLLLQEKNADPTTIGAGYYNFATGEEHYYNADQYRVSGSMYKVPLNMLFMDWVAEGKISMDESISGYRYSQLLEGTIIDSNNDYARMLWDYAGATIETNPASTLYHRYRILIAPLMGEDPDNVDDKYYENNFFTPRQMITCLRQLYDGGDRYQRLIKTMQRAEPEKYFKLRERRFNIAHKYGWYAEDPVLYLNDCALCFTDDPIAIVLFTSGTENAYGVVADFCTLMCDYAQEKHEERLAREAEEAAALAAAEERDRLAAEAAQTEPAAAQAVPGSAAVIPAAEQNGEPARGRALSLQLNIGHIIALALIIVGLLASIVWLVIRHRMNRLDLRFGLLAILLTAAAMILCFPGLSGQSMISAPDDNPQDTVELFFGALKRGDYVTADSCLAYGGSLGLPGSLTDETHNAAVSALQQSWDCAMLGNCSVEKASAWQDLQLQVLDFTKMESDLQRETRSKLLALARERNREAVYDEEGNYRPDVASEAYDLAMRSLLEHARDYYGSFGVRAELTLTKDGWKIVPSRELFSALCGNLA